MKKLFLIMLLLMIALSGCSSQADVASQNLSTAADNFQIMRRIVFYNGINGDYILTIEGKCSLGNSDAVGELTVTCKTGQAENGDGIYKKHFLGLSDNVTYFSEQIDAVGVSVYHYRVIFRPSVILPSLEVQ